MTYKTMVCLIAVALSATAQSKETDAEKKAIADQEKAARAVAEQTWVSKLFELKHADPERFFRLFNNLGWPVTTASGVNAIIVKAPKEAMPMIEDAVRRLDVPAVPPRNIELIAYMLLGLENVGAADEAPAELQSALKQLKATS